MSAIIIPFRRPGRFTPADRTILIAAVRCLPGSHVVRFEVDGVGDAWATIGPAPDGNRRYDPGASLFDAFLIGWEDGRMTLVEVASGQVLGRFATAAEAALRLLENARPPVAADAAAAVHAAVP